MTKLLNGNLLASENEILTSFGYFENKLALLQGRENKPYQHVQNPGLTSDGRRLLPIFSLRSAVNVKKPVWHKVSIAVH